jgi:hypothetical protein
MLFSRLVLVSFFPAVGWARGRKEKNEKKKRAARFILPYISVLRSPHAV